MSNNFKDRDIKNRTYYFFNDTINIKFFEPINNKTDGKSCKDKVIYCIGLRIRKNKQCKYFIPQFQEVEEIL